MTSCLVTKVPDGYYESDVKAIKNKKRNNTYCEMKKQKPRDMQMYKQTEALKNIENENSRYEFLQKLLSQI